MQITKEQVFHISDDLVVREIEGVTLVLPLSADIGEIEDKMYSFNETGLAIWNLLDGVRTAENVTKALCEAYEADYDEVFADVSALISELLDRKILLPFAS